MNNNEVMPIELDTTRTAAVQLLFESTKNLLLKYQLVDQFNNEEEVMSIGQR
jgi:hypothetical protein